MAEENAHEEDLNNVKPQMAVEHAQEQYLNISTPQVAEEKGDEQDLNNVNAKTPEEIAAELEQKKINDKIEEEKELKTLIVGSKYRLIEKFGNGSFGDVYLCVSTTSGQQFAVKVEKFETEHPQLLHEAKVLKKVQNGFAFPYFKWCGTVEKKYNMMVMQLLGNSIEELFTFCNRKFSMKTVLMLADQMIERVEYLHYKGYIHRDLKANNFVIGGGCHFQKVYMIDFGLAKKYLSKKKGHIPYTEKYNVVGTARFASINAHRGVEQSRRDDMMALGYLFIYFLKGQLPWQGVRGVTKEQKYEKIFEMKTSMRPPILCRGLPTAFEVYQEYCCQLEFKEKPDYVYLRRMFGTLFRTLNFKRDYEFDWTIKLKAIDDNARLKAMREAAREAARQAADSEAAAAVDTTPAAVENPDPAVTDTIPEDREISESPASNSGAPKLAARSSCNLS